MGSDNRGGAWYNWRIALKFSDSNLEFEKNNFLDLISRLMQEANAFAGYTEDHQ